MAALDWKSINLVPRPEVGPDRGKDGWALFGEDVDGKKFYATISRLGDDALSRMTVEDAYASGQECLFNAVRTLAHVAETGESV